MSQKFANNVMTKLAAGVLDSDSTLTVEDGSMFPVLAPGDFFLATVSAKNPSGLEEVWEIVRVTSVSGNFLTVERGHERTPARSWSQGDMVSLRLTAGTADGLSLAREAVVATPGAVLAAGLTYGLEEIGAYLLPASPASGTRIGFLLLCDPSESAPLTVQRNGQTIDFRGEDLIVDGARVRRWDMVFAAGTWRVVV